MSDQGIGGGRVLSGHAYRTRKDSQGGGGTWRDLSRRWETHKTGGQRMYRKKGGYVREEKNPTLEEVALLRELAEQHSGKGKG